MKKRKAGEEGVLEGRKLTRGRKEILTAINDMKGHFDAQSLYEQLKREGANVSRASVYRTIPVLVETGIIREVEKTEKHAHYEKVTGVAHHDHLICLRCGKAIEIYSPTLEMLQEELCQREGFKGVRHTLEIMGYCRDCAHE